MEGVSQEAIALAGHLKLSRLIVLWDDNGISIDGSIALSDSTDQIARFEASGWATARIDGHNADEIAAAIETARASDRPTLIACKTTISFGAPTKAGTSGCHGSPLGTDEIAGPCKTLDWPYAPFEIPETIPGIAVLPRTSLGTSGWRRLTTNAAPPSLRSWNRTSMQLSPQP